jgi:GntR family transcriptional regulator
VTVQRPQAQYRQVALLLREAIESGEYPPGSTLPPEAELGERYGVSRDVVNKAVRVLRAWGLVRVVRGTGSIVRQIPKISRNAVARYQTAARERAGARGAFDTELRSLGLEPRADTAIDRIPAPADVAEALQIAVGDPVIRRGRKMYARRPGGDDVPVQLAPSYIPASIADGTPLAEVDSGPGGIISRFAELGHRQVRITETIQVRPATDQEREFLAMEEDELAIEIWHVGWTADGRPVELAVHVVPSALWVLDYEWAVD